MDLEKIAQSLDKVLDAGRREIPFGEVADYIPELAKSDKNALGIAIADRSGHTMPYSKESVWNHQAKRSTP